MNGRLRALAIVLLTAAISGCGQTYAGLPEALTIDPSLELEDAQAAVSVWNEAFPGCPHTVHAGHAGPDTYGGVYLAPKGNWEDPRTEATYDPNTGSIAIGRTSVPSFWVPRLLLHEIGHGHQAEHAASGLFAPVPSGVALVTLAVDEPMRAAVCEADALCCVTEGSEPLTQERTPLK